MSLNQTIRHWYRLELLEENCLFALNIATLAANPKSKLGAGLAAFDFAPICSGQARRIQLPVRKCTNPVWSDLVYLLPKKGWLLHFGEVCFSETPVTWKKFLQPDIKVGRIEPEKFFRHKK